MRDITNAAIYFLRNHRDLQARLQNRMLPDGLVLAEILAQWFPGPGQQRAERIWTDEFEKRLIDVPTLNDGDPWPAVSEKDPS